MIVFRSIQNDPSLPDYGATQEDGRIWVGPDGRIHVRGKPYVVDIASRPLALTFGGEINPATDPEAFLAALPARYHGTYLWAEPVD